MKSRPGSTPAPRNGPEARASRAPLRRKLPRQYVLKLYVGGADRKSDEAVRKITGFCDEYLRGRYRLAIIDVYQQPARAREKKIIAVPTLIRELPLPPKRLIGNLADLDTVLVGLDLRPRS
jgi:circadian clock protein KaiB